MSELHPVQGESDVTWEEVEYEVYSDFEDSDRYKSSEQMAAMREDKENKEPPSDKDEDTTAYETAAEEQEPEQGARVKYMSTHDFREIQKGEAIYQYHVQMACKPINRSNKINFGTNSSVEMPGYTGLEYFDVVNIDRHEVLIRTPFMHCHKVVLNFDKKCVQGRDWEEMPIVQIVEDKEETGCTLHPLPPENRSILQGDDNGGIDDHIAHPSVCKGCRPRGDKHNHPPETAERKGDRQDHPTPHAEKSRMERKTLTTDHGSVEVTVQESYDEECQPTSSRVKVEDLVTDEDD
ncbi:hypothetical protein ARMGADRAFT_1035976 [Armillaria gallica]|uniref:Uncharacterized protein n=1 Tax=Armillaria gallica TaxID=47427 RepID=A0A2H3CX00_ARMGA|nr:hypothetical protein ARMGADRAFT_1035976 [Armillaria gallica]